MSILVNKLTPATREECAKCKKLEEAAAENHLSAIFSDTNSEVTSDRLGVELSMAGEDLIRQEIKFTRRITELKKQNDNLRRDNNAASKTIAELEVALASAEDNGHLLGLMCQTRNRPYRYMGSGIPSCGASLAFGRDKVFKVSWYPMRGAIVCEAWG